MEFGIVTKKCENCGCEFRCMDDVRIIYCHDCYLEVYEPDDYFEDLVEVKEWTSSS